MTLNGKSESPTANPELSISTTGLANQMLAMIARVIEIPTTRPVCAENGSNVRYAVGTTKRTGKSEEMLGNTRSR
jgi:hypothetical protein